MTIEQIPLIQKDISMLTEKIDKVSDKVEEEARKSQAHRDETLKFHADQKEADAKFREELLEKLEWKFAGKWVEKAFLMISGIVATTIIAALLRVIIK